MRLIDADALKENIENWYALVNEWGQAGITLSHDDIIGKIDNQPTVDVLEQIRAEIEHLDYLNIEDGSDGYDKYVDQYDVLQIIDKYKKG